MSGCVNSVQLLGHTCTDVEVRYTASGQPVANIRIATNEGYTDKTGKKQERSEFHRIVVWGKLAELCGQYLTKGRQVFVEGALRTRQWEDKEKHMHYTTEIQASNVLFLGPRPKTEQAEVEEVSAELPDDAEAEARRVLDEK